MREFMHVVVQQTSKSAPIHERVLPVYLHYDASDPRWQPHEGARARMLETVFGIVADNLSLIQQRARSGSAVDCPCTQLTSSSGDVTLAFMTRARSRYSVLSLGRPDDLPQNQFVEHFDFIAWAFPVDPAKPHAAIPILCGDISAT